MRNYITQYNARLQRRLSTGLAVRKFTTRQSRVLLESGFKYCPSCQRLLELTCFSTMKVRTGIASHCKECSNTKAKERNSRPENIEKRASKYARDKHQQRDKHLRKRFGITLLDYNSLLEQQHGVCAICGKTDKRKSLAVDHDHITGQVRGLLCGRCNPALGFILENSNYANQLIKYIERHKQ